MGGGVADNIQPLLALVGNDRQLGIVGNAMGGINQTAIHLASQSGLGQTGTDIGGNVKDRDRLGKFAAGTIGESDNRHEQSFYRSGDPYERPRGKTKRRHGGSASVNGPMVTL